MKQEPLLIKTFGGFSVRNGDKYIFKDNVKGSKVHHLLQYLLIHRGERFSKEALIHIIYSYEEVDDPANALKVIIYRLRKLLEDYGISSECQLIFGEGQYYWSDHCIWNVDALEFDDYIRRANSDDCPEDEKLRLYRAAIDLYEGDFLPHLAGEEWALRLSVGYQNLYLGCVHELYDRAGDSVPYEDMLDICSRAVAIYPYNEELHYMLIQCLYKTKRNREALAAYNSVVDMLFNEYGVSPSEELQELYKELSEKLQTKAESVQEILLSMKEDPENEGAYYCNFQAFSDSYRFVVRGIERSGQSVFLMLCNIVNEKGRVPETGDALTEAVEDLFYAVKKVLRKGDLFTRYSATQYLILLIGINQENCGLVFGRIEKAFNKLNKSKDLHIQYRTVSAADVNMKR